MSVTGVVQLVNDDDVAWLRRHVQRWGDDLPDDPDQRDVLGAPGQLVCELGKAWEAVSYLLHGGTKRRPLSFLDDEGLGEKTRHEFTYGPGRVFPTEFILELKAAMDSIGDEEVERRARSAALQQVYPFNVTGRPLGDGDREWVVQAYDGLSAFLWQASEQVRQGGKPWLLVAYV
jgi:hypothetical protein